MSLSPEKTRELCSQFSSLHDGSLSAPEMAALEKRMQSDAELRQLYVHFTRVCAGLDWDFARSFETITVKGGRNAEQESAVPVCSPVLGFLSTVTLWAVRGAGRPAIFSIAAVLVLALGVALTVWRLPMPQTAEVTASPRVVARLSRTMDCIWQTGCPIVQPGDELRVGQKLELLGGRAEIEFFGGAVVTLDGPAVLTMRSEQEWALDRGRLAARLPKGHSNFNVMTPSVNVAKCSSEFTVSVDERKHVEVRVIKGEMEASSNHSDVNKPIQLTAGMSARFDPSKATPVTHVDDTPLSPELAQWRDFSNQLRDRHDLIGYYTFEQTGNDSALPNIARHGVGGIGSINGPTWTDGRFLGKRALMFGDGRHVMLGLKYKKLVPPFTIAAWICPNDTSVSQRIFSSPPTFQPQGFGFGLTPSGMQLTAWSGKNYDVTAPLAAGAWSQVAVTIDDTGEAAFYLNGKPVGTQTIQPPLAPAEDEFFIGSYGHREFFQGRIDELAVFQLRMSAAEIAELFEPLTAND